MAQRLPPRDALPDLGVRTQSGGMRRRLGLARALVNDPRLLLRDEPIAGLERQARQLMRERLQGLAGAVGADDAEALAGIWQESAATPPGRPAAP